MVRCGPCMPLTTAWTLLAAFSSQEKHYRREREAQGNCCGAGQLQQLCTYNAGRTPYSADLDLRL